MRWFIVAVVALAGCAEISGLDGLEVCDGSCADATSDGAGPDVREAGGDDAGLDASVPDAIGDDAPTCTRPEDCAAGNVCCLRLVRSGTTQSCTTDSSVIACAPESACASSYPFATCGTIVARRCGDSGDCKESIAPTCCRFPDLDGGNIALCATATIAALYGATCP